MTEREYAYEERLGICLESGVDQQAAIALALELGKGGVMSHRLDYFPDRNTNTGRELIQAYRNVFSSKQAPTVLWHMLYELGAFEETTDATPEEVALK